MIITITQTASNVKQLYRVDGDSFHYEGKAGSFSELQSVVLSGKKTTLKGFYKPSEWINYIPCRHLFGKECITRQFLLYENDEFRGSIVFSKHGYLKSFYVIALESGEIFHCYVFAKGSFEYVSIYKGEAQIALVETNLSMNDYKYIHKLYILDDHDRFAETFSFFVLYYASYEFVKRFHMSKGSYDVKAWSFSKYSNKYDEKWRETHFPNENFFGPIYLFNN